MTMLLSPPDSPVVAKLPGLSGQVAESGATDQLCDDRCPYCTGPETD